MFSYARRDLLRNPRRTLASLVGIVLGVGLFSGVLFFIDGSGASMTKRALAPLTLDMQRVLTSPLGKGLRLEERVSATGALRKGEQTRVTLTVLNQGLAPVNEVVVRDKPARALEYVPGTAIEGRRPIPDVSGQSPFAHGPAEVGHNIGTVAPGARVMLSYLARARSPVPAVSELPLQATISTRENLVPESANPPALASLAELQRRIAKIPGVAAADQLASADLPAGSLRSATSTVDRPIRIFGFDQTYAEHYPAIRLAAGSFDPNGALLSSEASRALGVGAGEAVELSLPGRKHPINLPISGIVDLSRAKPLFNSRKGSNLEDFLYTADSIVVSPKLFGKTVIPAARAASAARGNALKVKSVPILEVDVAIDRTLLKSDPATALGQTESIANSITKIAPGQDYLLDNISNTLQVARSDAAVAKRMFLFLGLPGLLLAAFLAAYAGSVLASTQRREQANLRLRGANRGHLLRILAYRTAAVAGVGSVLGAATGFASVAVILGPSVLFEATPATLLISALVAIGSGILTTGLALFVPGHRALSRDVSGERREMAVERQPAWRRMRLDYGAVVLAGGAAVIALRAGAFDAPLGSVMVAKKPMMNEPVAFTKSVPSGKVSPIRSATSPEAQNRAPVPSAPPSMIQR